MTNLKAFEPGTLTRMVAEAMREADPLGRGYRGDWTAYAAMAEAALAVAFNPNRGARVE